MALTVGTQLGSHEIVALLGKGGMGEVYRARDTKLKREVAIKILPDEFSRDADRVSHFQREAEVLASLNHPNIAGILWQISSSDGGNPPVRWTRSGNEVSYLGLDGRLYVVSYTVNGPLFNANPPRLWSQKLPTSAAGPVMMPDGKHAVVVLASPEAAAPRQTHVRFLLNFPDELQRHTRAGK
jgi:serine/threonine protein kinase